MESILKISDAASLALHALAYIAAVGEEQKPVSVSRMAKDLKVSEAHLGKVLQRLGKTGFVSSRRGPRGGFSLRRSASDIFLLEIYEAIDGPLEAGTCLLGRPVCGDGTCILEGLLEVVYEQVHRYLKNKRLSDLRFCPDAFKMGETAGER